MNVTDARSERGITHIYARDYSGPSRVPWVFALCGKKIRLLTLDQFTDNYPVDCKRCLKAEQAKER